MELALPGRSPRQARGGGAPGATGERLGLAPLIREFRAEDAAGAAQLLRELDRGSVTTEGLLLHRVAAGPERAHRRSWVAVEGGDVIGWATAQLRWISGPMGMAELWVAVRADRRSRGIGAELYRRSARHLAGNGARAAHTYVDDDEAGARFVRERGFHESTREIVSALRPAESDTSELETLTETRLAEGFRLAPLGELGGLEPGLFDFYGRAGAWPPVSDPGNRIAFDEWRRVILESPLLSPEGSFVVVADQRPVALSWLLVDDAGRAENEWTATLPEFRGRGLARLAKLATIRWAAEREITEIVTGNNVDNIAMLTLNQQLGYSELFVRQEYEREL